jgi:formate--tetrahydrofolate ligase
MPSLMQTGLLPIQTVAQKLQIPDRYFEPIGLHGGKIRLDLLSDPWLPRRGKLILVTATTPVASGEGKTVTAIGLVQGLARIGKRSVVTLRQPSLGPVFGMKGGATGGGLSQIEPSEKINLHFHGDFHGIASAQNLLAALIDAHFYHGNDLHLDPEQISWPRTMDMNDRALRQISIALDSTKEGAGRRTGFVITAACEAMAIVALAHDRADLRRRLDSIVIGADREGSPIRGQQLNATGGMMALLADAMLPNLAQTTDGTPALVHTGPFGNIAPGTSSVLSQDIGLRLADYVVNEVGFGSDLGAEKYFDIVMQQSGIAPSAAVLVTTVGGIRNQGEGQLTRGLPNLGKHIEILKSFGVPIVAAINAFPGDSAADLKRLADFCSQHAIGSAVSEAFTKGGSGAKELSECVLEAVAANPSPIVRSAYSLDEPLAEKIHRVSHNIYGATEVSLSEQAKTKLDRFASWGADRLPICVAKTQYSLSDNPKLLGTPADWTLHVKDVALSAGAGFVVVITGNTMLMPGLPKQNRAASIDVDDLGRLVNL